MINKLIILTVFLCTLIIRPAIGQSKDDTKYLVITFEVTSKPSKLKKHYYWIALLDSVMKKNAFEIFPLYTDDYSIDTLEKCKEGRYIDIFTLTTVTSFNFRKEYKGFVKSK